MSFGLVKLGGTGGGAYVPVNTPSTATALDGTSAIPAPTNQREIRYVKSTGGEIPIPTPQVGVGTIHGQELILMGASDTDFPSISDQNGLYLNGTCRLKFNSSIYLMWNAPANAWVEGSRNDL